MAGQIPAIEWARQPESKETAPARGDLSGGRRKCRGPSCRGIAPVTNLNSQHPRMFPTSRFRGTDETIFRNRRNQPETRIRSDVCRSTTGFGHGGTDHQLSLSRTVQAVFERHATATPLGLGFR
jgi:hypothetical protein